MASRSASGTTKDRTKSSGRSTNSGSTNGKPGTSSKAPSEKKGKSRTKAKGSAKQPKTWESRAVVRLIEAGSTAECPECGERVKFRARHRDQQVICNVYIDGVWDRVEQYHAECYETAGSPHGEAIKK
ncbi:MAG: hypothetical protein OES24_13165 [Acidimicrobiia bacterium]|nr:hypothetical protein [Acidimicrobiia bacterium]